MLWILKVVKTVNNTLDGYGTVHLVNCASSTNLSNLTIKSLIIHRIPTIISLAIKCVSGKCLNTVNSCKGFPAAGGVHLLIVEMSDGFFK